MNLGCIYCKVVQGVPKKTLQSLNLWSVFFGTPCILLSFDDFLNILLSGHVLGGESPVETER